MAKANPRFAFTEVKIPGNVWTTSLMKWQKIGSDNLPMQTIYIKRRFKGEDPLKSRRLPEIMKRMRIETAFIIQTLDVERISPDDKKTLNRLLRFGIEQSKLKYEYEVAEENEIKKIITEGRRFSMK